MVAIFTTKSNLEDICLDPSKQAWYEMLLKLKEVFINDESMPLDEEDPLFILDNMQVDVVSSKKEYIESIPDNPSLVLQEPCGIFLLDINPSDAQKIQDDYGVICQSVSAMNHRTLTHGQAKGVYVGGEKGKSWKDLFRKFQDCPSNSMLIIDAHLFENDYFDEKENCYDNRRNLGITNLYEIIDAAIPKTFTSIYQIGVLLTNVDRAKELHRSRTNLTNSKIAAAINKLKKRINREYNISVDVIFLDPSINDQHKLIHNRRIISNYYILDANYKLAALNQNIANCSQNITIGTLFEHIDEDSEPDMNEKRLRYDLDDLYEYIKSQKVHNPTGEWYSNGQKQTTFNSIKHRLLT
jgi:hypothetical protein